VTSSRSISIFRLAYTLHNRAKLGQKLFCPPREVTAHQNDSTHSMQPSRDFTYDAKC